MFDIALKFLNNRYGDKIPDDLNPKIDNFIDNLTSANYDDAEKEFADIMAQLIKTPLIDGTAEEIEAFQMLISGLDKLVRYFLKKSK